MSFSIIKRHFQSFAQKQLDLFVHIIQAQTAEFTDIKSVVHKVKHSLITTSNIKYGENKYIFETYAIENVTLVILQKNLMRNDIMPTADKVRDKVGQHQNYLQLLKILRRTRLNKMFSALKDKDVEGTSYENNNELTSVCDLPYRGVRHLS